MTWKLLIDLEVGPDHTADDAIAGRLLRLLSLAEVHTHGKVNAPLRITSFSLRAVSCDVDAVIRQGFDYDGRARRASQPGLPGSGDACYSQRPLATRRPG